MQCIINLLPFRKKMTSYKTYYSRVSVSLLAFVTLAFALPMVFAILCDGLLPFIICLASLLIIYGLLFSIRYKIKDEKLQIYTLFWHQDIRISKINRMEESNCLLSSPAASFNRLAIYWGDKNKVVYISPRHQDEFIREINSIAHLDEK